MKTFGNANYRTTLTLATMFKFQMKKRFTVECKKHGLICSLLGKDNVKNKVPMNKFAEHSW